MTEERIERLNHLARKYRTIGLTDKELEERTALRQEYLEAIRQSLEAQLENTYVMDENGNPQKLKKKEDEEKQEACE